MELPLGQAVAQALQYSGSFATLSVSKVRTEEAMKLRALISRGIPTLLAAALAVASAAPAAQADRHDVRFKGPSYNSGGGWHGGGYRGYRGGWGHPVFVREHSGVGPAIGGFIGGLVLGSVLTHANDNYYPPPPPVVYRERVVAPAYRYYDPYCGSEFSSLDAYRDHAYRARHPLVARVIDVRTGDCVDTYCWHDGGWRSGYGPDYDCRQYRDDRGYGDDHGWRDDRGDDDDDDQQ
jgi:hypothetical protein